MSYNKLTPEEERIIVDKATEAPFSGNYDNFYEDGTFICRRCNAPLFSSKSKFDAGCGWPSFDESFQNAINGLVSKGLFLDVFWNITVRCWNASKEFIGYRRSSRQFPHYMINFETVAKEAELYGKKYHGHASDLSAEP